MSGRSVSPVRLIVALSVAAVLAVFLLYTSIAGSTPALKPSQLKGRHGQVALVGIVVGPVSGDAHRSGLRFKLRDRGGSAAVPVTYTGSKPDLFAVGREVTLQGHLTNGIFVGARDSLSTKCPSKYSPQRKQ